MSTEYPPQPYIVGEEVLFDGVFKGTIYKKHPDIQCRVLEIWKSPACGSGWLVRISVYDSPLDSGWLKKIPVQNTLL